MTSTLQSMLNSFFISKPKPKPRAVRRPLPPVTPEELMNAPTGLALPTGARSGPNCGVTATAVVCGLTFDEAWHKLRNGRNANWKGKTTVADWMHVLTNMGIAHEVRMVKTMTLHRWVNVYSKRGVTYMVRTSGHVQVVKDGWVLDQGGAKPLHKFWGRAKRLTHVIEILT